MSRQAQRLDGLDPDPLRPDPVEPRLPHPPRFILIADSDAREIGRLRAYIVGLVVLVILLLGAIAVLLVIAVVATPRSASIPTVDRPASERLTGGATDPRAQALDASGWAPIGAPHRPTGAAADELAAGPLSGGAPNHRAEAPAASPSGPFLDEVTRQGVASHMGSAPVGPRYLALPMGPGWRVRLCGPAACDDVVSTDAGPSLAMQRAGRVADLSVELFERLCGVPASYGLCDITWTVERRPR